MKLKSLGKFRKYIARNLRKVTQYFFIAQREPEILQIHVVPSEEVDQRRLAQTFC